MDARYIMAFVRSVENVFGTMVQTQVTIGEPVLKAPGQPRYDISGIIGMSGDVTGAVVLSFPADTAERVVSLFTGSPVQASHPDFCDAIGELVNMITGGAKADFAGKHVTISCPSVVVGQGHQIFQPRDASIIEIPCECDCGPFSIDVTIQEVESPVAAQTATGAAAHA